MLQLQVQSTLFIYFLSVDFISTFFRTGFLTDVDGEWVGGGGRGWGVGFERFTAVSTLID